MTGHDFLPQHKPPDGGIQQVTNGNGGNVPAAKSDGRSADADFQIVVAIDHGIFRIVGQDPEQIAQHQPQGLLRNVALRGGKGHGNAPAEGDAQYGLRHRHEPFGIRIGDADEQGGDGAEDGLPGCCQHQQKRNKSQNRTHGQCFSNTDPAAGDRALRRAFHMPVKFPIGHIVDAATRAAHEDGSPRENRQQMPARKPASR